MSEAEELIYDVVDYYVRSEFVAMVNRRLSLGWTLVGGISICDNGVNRHWAQAMTYPKDLAGEPAHD